MTDQNGDAETIDVAVATRTLLASGFTITNFERQAVHVEFVCERVDVFGASVRYLVMIANTGPNSDIVAMRKRYAESTGRVLLRVNDVGTVDAMSWSDFLTRLGGPVPQWRALADDFADIVAKSGANTVPQGMSGEAWRIFEDAVADGFEYVLGWRVRRLGNRKRGSRVPDLVTKTPDGSVLVVDTKASVEPFDVGFPELRPLLEYVNVQQVRQTGAPGVGAAVVVANAYKQAADRLAQLSREFLAESRVPATFVTTPALLAMIAGLTADPSMRNKTHWRRLLCGGGLVDVAGVTDELKRACDESVREGV